MAQENETRPIRDDNGQIIGEETYMRNEADTPCWIPTYYKSEENKKVETKQQLEVGDVIHISEGNRVYLVERLEKTFPISNEASIGEIYKEKEHLEKYMKSAPKKLLDLFDVWGTTLTREDAEGFIREHIKHTKFKEFSIPAGDFVVIKTYRKDGAQCVHLQRLKDDGSYNPTSPEIYFYPNYDCGPFTSFKGDTTVIRKMKVGFS
ncbi:MAG: hypothetical protein LBO09_02320 [Candidatus Peribacteria bacterium]|jgi:hypothetical protein|nr:hypothetical protein [Candidatus Peribacteria bacterium]